MVKQSMGIVTRISRYENPYCGPRVAGLIRSNRSKPEGANPMSVVAESQTSEERLGFPTPPDHQCPSIDYVINAIRTCEKYMKKYDRMDEEELKSAMWEVEREMFDLEKKMELIRSACEGLRDWGQSWKDLCKRAADLRDLDLEDL